jgi:hypothetical protein
MSKRKKRLGDNAPLRDLDLNLKLIDEFTRALELLDSEEKTPPTEALLADATSSAQNWKVSGRPLFRGDSERTSIKLFRGLVGALQPVLSVLKLLQQIRLFCPGELVKLIEASRCAEYCRVVEMWPAREEAKQAIIRLMGKHPQNGITLRDVSHCKICTNDEEAKSIFRELIREGITEEHARGMTAEGGEQTTAYRPTKKLTSWLRSESRKRSESKRRLKKGNIAEIEWIGEPTMSTVGSNPLLEWLPRRVPTPIFDKVLRGEHVSRVELQKVVDVSRREFPKNLSKTGYLRLAQLLRHLLREPTKKGNKRWYRDPDQRARVLNAIVQRLGDPSVDARIADALMAVVRPHLKR